MKKIFLITVFLLATGWNWGAAQNPDDVISARNLRFLIEENADRNLSAILNTHFPENHFLIKTEIEVAPLDASERPVALPPAFTEHPDAESVSGINRYLPNLWKNATLKINRTTVYFILDNSFSESVKQQMQKLIIQSANLDLTRGDVLEFEQVNFNSPETPDGTRVHPRPARAQINFNQLKFYLPVFTGLLCSMFLGLLIFKSQKSAESGKSGSDNQASRPHQNAVDAASEKTVSAPVSVAEIEQIVATQPGLTVKLLQRWIEQSPVSGAQNCALLLKRLPLEQQRNLFHQFSEKQRQFIQKGASHIIGQNPTAATQVIHDFIVDFRQFASVAKNPVRYQNLHHFLGKKSVQQINQLLENLEDGYKAIVLAHLPAGKAVRHLKMMPEKIQMAILSTLGRLDKISHGIFERLAQSLSGLEQIQIQVNPALIDGVLAIKGILNAAGTEYRETLVQFIKKFDPALKLKLESFGMAPDFTWAERPIDSEAESRTGSPKKIQSIDKKYWFSGDSAVGRSQRNFRLSHKDFSVAVEN